LQFPVIVLIFVFLLIVVRQIGEVRIKIYQAMLLGAITVLVSGHITFYDAVRSINPDVMLFLFGMFLLGSALEESGYLSHLSYEVFKRSRTLDGLILSILFVIGCLSALLMNDTLAIIGTPAVIHIARKHHISPKVLLLSLAFAVTTGSVMSPIGNPQNLLIAIHGDIKNPFIVFLKFLFIPTMVNLFITYLVLKVFFSEHFNDNFINHNQEPIRDLKLAKISRFSLLLLCCLVMIKILTAIIPTGIEFKLTYIAIISALPVLLFSDRRKDLLKKMDWATLIFFASMFVLIQSVWDTGFFQSFIQKDNIDIKSVSIIFLVSIFLSQFISNVPLVALYIPLLQQSGGGTKEMLALAAGSTIAGNLSILGAASNVIIIQNAESRNGDSISFWEFLKVGLPLTLLNAIVYWLYLFLFA